ncbi:MAG TPA: NAD(P)H-binding protein [Terriglobales bacterium]|nr:NAD(P)H-binding protein [Terriglobales bacterium]
MLFVNVNAEKRCVFVAGGTGYLGRPLITELLRKAHIVRALVRAGSEHKVPSGCEQVYGSPLNRSTYQQQIAPADTFVHLVGVAHPSPSKAAEFRSIDFKSACESISAAVTAGIQHFVYVSVAHPAPMMKAYIAIRNECEDLLRGSGMNATILRPWYVLGPGHRWPYALLPMYWLAERLPGTRDGARRLGLVTRKQMCQALVTAVENPAQRLRIVEVPEIRVSGASPRARITTPA